MKNILSFITALTLALSLTACRARVTNDPEEERSKAMERYSSELAESMTAFPENIALPDGGTVSKSELTFPGYEERIESGSGYPWLEYAYIRYAEPVFITSLDAPEKFDAENYALKEPIKLKPFEWIKVKAGDVLENGWKITSARSYCTDNEFDDDPNALVFDCEIRLEGEITLDGILNYSNGSEAYGKWDYFLKFYPDSTNCKLPVAFNRQFLNEGCSDEPQTSRLGNDGLIAYDGARFYYFRFEADFRDRLTEDAAYKAKFTVKDMILKWGDYNGEIVSAEF